MTNHISYLNQIFYNHKKFEKEDIACLEKWMGTKSWIDRVKMPKYGKTVWIRISKNGLKITKSQNLEKENVEKGEKRENNKNCLKVPDFQKNEQNTVFLKREKGGKMENTKNCLKVPDFQKNEENTVFLKREKGGKMENNKNCLKVPDFQKNEQKQSFTQQRFLSKKQDTLFWAIYVAKYGEDVYREIANKYKNVEMEEKLKIVNYISSNKTDIQNKTLESGNKKIPSTKLQEIKSDFMIAKKTSYLMLWIMCMYYDINVVIFKPYTFMKMYTRMDPEPEKIHVLFEEKSGYFSLDEQSYSSDKLEEMFESRIYVDHMSDKIFKSVSSYTMEEIIDFAKKLEIIEQVMDQYTKPTKNDWMREMKRKLGE